MTDSVRSNTKIVMKVALIHWELGQSNSGSSIFFWKISIIDCQKMFMKLTLILERLSSKLYKNLYWTNWEFLNVAE